MTSRNRVLILVGSSAEPGHLFASALGRTSPASALSAAYGTEVSLAVISWTPSVEPLPDVETSLSLSRFPPVFFDRVLNSMGAHALRRVLARYPIGRLINSLSPTDPSRVFWRAVRHSAKADALIDEATIVIAADPEAVKVAWNALHRGRVGHAFYGLPATIKEIGKGQLKPEV